MVKQVVVLTLLVVCTLCWIAATSGEDATPGAAKSVLDSVERLIVKEPKYLSTPRYALLVLGTKAESKVWMVEDGKTLYIDRNANGDLTDDGPPVKSKNETELGKLASGLPNFDMNYFPDDIAPPRGPRLTDFNLRRWNYGDKEDSYGLSLTLDGKTPLYAGWFGTFWAKSPAEVPLVHFGGPLYPRLLGSKEFIAGRNSTRLNIGFVTDPARDKGAVTYLSIDALPRTVTPEVQIDWPVADGAPPLRTSYLLTQRCCYWAFFDPEFKVPAGVVAGAATLTVSLLGGDLPFELATDQIEATVRLADNPQEK